jgi:hypothetical protein
MNGAQLEPITKKATTLRMLLERFTSIAAGEDAGQPVDIAGECLIAEELAGEIERALKALAA